MLVILYLELIGTSNTAYTAHSQKNNEQSANNFYVVTDQLNVYKCFKIMQMVLYS